MDFTGPWVAADGDETVYVSSSQFIDPADGWDWNVAEAIFQCPGGGRSPNNSSAVGAITLVHSSDPTTPLATLTFSTADQNCQRKETTFTPVAVAGRYMIRIDVVPGNNFVCDFANAVILLDSPDQFWVPYTILTGDASQGGFLAPDNDYWSYVCSAIDPAWISDPADSSGIFDLFVKDESAFSTLDKWRLDVIGWGADERTAGPGTDSIAHGRLTNESTGMVVAGSQLDFPEHDPTFKSVEIPNNAANFTDGDRFTLEISATANTGVETIGYFSRGMLWAHVIAFKSADIACAISNVFGHNTATSGVRCRSRIDPAWFPPNYTVRYVGTAVAAAMPDQRMVVQKSPDDFGRGGSEGVAGTRTITAGVWQDDPPVSALVPSGFFISNTPLEVMTMELSNFTFNAPIVDPILNATVAGPVGPVPQTAVFSTGINGGALVNKSQGPVTLPALAGQSWNHGAAFVAADFAAPTVQLRVAQPNNATLSNYWWQNIRLFVEFGTPVGALDFTGLVGRQRLETPVTIDENLNYFSNNGVDDTGHGFLIFSVTRP